MIRIVKMFIVVSVIALLFSCATSMTPMEVNNTLPALTKSRFISQVQAEKDIQSNRCKYLVKGRTYAAPIGFTVKDDLRNGAKGIDEWVKIDGGNAYVLTNYKWVTINGGMDGAAQLYVEFDTLLYE
ncbi:MAG: hypothetical protein AB2L13_17360 [Spirochaetota bacterium]